MKVTLKRLSLVVLGFVAAFCFAMVSFGAKNSFAQETVPTGKTELYQLAPSDSLYEGYVIKTSEGSLIVIDGGSWIQDMTVAEGYIDAALQAIAGKADYTVKYWFLSHAHGDHIHEFANLLNSQTINFTIENIVFDFPTFVSKNGKYVTSFNDNCALDSGDVTAWNLLKDGLNNYAAKKSITYSADSYYEELNGKFVNENELANGPKYFTVDDVKIEVLSTFSNRDTQVNSNSMILRAWVDGQSVLFLNDATVESGNRLIETYGKEYLKSDIVSMAHHGQNGVAKNVYDAVNAKVRLWSCNQAIWNVGGSYKTDEVRSWVGLPESAAEFTQTEYDLVAGLCASPQNITSVSAWSAALDGMKIELPYVSAYEHTFFADNGAFIRLNEGSTGIRFTATLASYDEQAEYGFVIAPRAALDKLEVTENFASALITEYGTGDNGVIKLASAVTLNGGLYKIKGSIANIKDKNIKLDFVGIPYKYKNEVYTDAYISSLDNVTRNVAEVAAAAYNDAIYNSAYDTNEKAIIKGFIDTSVDNADYTLSFANSTETLTVYESKALSLSSNVDVAHAVWTSSNESVATVNDKGVVTALKAGNATITAKNAGVTANCTVTVANEADNVITSFSGKGSEIAASYVPKEYRDFRRSGLIETEWLESYKGANGVLKVTTYSAITAPFVADIRLTLPKEIVNGATVRYLVEESDATYIYFYNESVKNDSGDMSGFSVIAAGAALTSSAKNIWTPVFVDYKTVTSDKSALNILIQGGSANFKNVFYFDVIEEGDSTAKYDNLIDRYYDITEPLAEELTGNYLADFSDDAYTQLAITDTYGNNHVATSVTAERLETFDNTTNVLKVTTVSNSSSFGDFTLVLPKKMGSNGYTIRFMVQSTENNVLRILKPRTEIEKIWEVYNDGLTAIIGSWQEMHVNYTGDYKQEITFQIYGTAGATSVFYIDYVADGNCVEEMSTARKQASLIALASALTGDYLADFSSAAYVYTIDYSSGQKAESITAEYLSSYNGESGVVKVTTKMNSVNWGPVKVVLPKPSTSGTVTVRYMVETGATSMWFTKPGTGNTVTAAQGTANVTATTTWQTVALDYSENKDCIELLFANSPQGTSAVVYFAWIREGNCVSSAFDDDDLAASLTTRTTLAATLGEGYLADFSDSDYANLVFASNYLVRDAASVSAEVVSDSSCGNVLKVTTTNNANGIGDIKLLLPKSGTSGNVTIKIKVGSTGCEYVRFLQPGTQNGAYLKEGDDAIANISTDGEWHTMTLNYTGNQIDIMLQQGGGAGGENVIYIAYVLDGAEDLISSASNLFRGNEEFILFADKPAMADSTRILDYLNAGFTHYLMTEDYSSLFCKDSGGNFLTESDGSYVFNQDYIDYITTAINKDLKVIMRNMGNKTDYFSNLTAAQIATLNSLISGYYMCDEPSYTTVDWYNQNNSPCVNDLISLVQWFNQNGGNAFFHVNLLQSYGIEEIVHSGENVTFEDYLAYYVENILKTVNGTKTLSLDFYALAAENNVNYVKSDFIRNLYAIAAAAKNLKADGHDIITNFCVQIEVDTGLNLREISSVADIRFQTAMFAAFGATSFEYFGFTDMYDINSLSGNDIYGYVKTVNAELQSLAKAISLFDWNGYKFLANGGGNVTNISGTQLSAFSGIASVVSTGDTVVSEFVKDNDDYAYMAVNYAEPSSNSQNTVTFTLNGESSAVVYVNGIRSDVLRVSNNTYSVTLNAGDYVFIYPYN